MILEATTGDLLVIIPAGVVLSAAGVWLYIVKKRDRQSERIAKAHSPPTHRRSKPSDSDPHE